MTWFPNGAIVITVKTEITHAKVFYNREQGGLLDMELHPDSAENGRIYMTVASTEDSYSSRKTVLIRCKFESQK